MSKKRIRGKRGARRRTKYEEIDPGLIWRTALEDLFNQHAECLTAKPDKLRFQTGRLLENLKRRIEATGKDRLRTMQFCYWFVTEPSLQLGYDEPRRLHFEEMSALNPEQSVSKQDGYRSLTPAEEEKIEKHLGAYLERLKSIASWMEAQESFSMWLAFRKHRGAWQADRDASLRAEQASILATLPRYMRVYEFKGRKVRGASLWEGLGVGTNHQGVTWSRWQWASILEEAARLVKKREVDCTPLERWVWWCFPVFQRYGWNWREIKEAADARKFRGVEETAEHFRRHWMTLGLRITGKKTSRKEPPLAQFVSTVSIPTELPFEIPIWGDHYPMVDLRHHLSAN